jgi:diguanylate cyclase (GGDEF)-like protein
VTLISEGSAPHYVAASNAEALLFEQLQTELNEGPCLASYRSGEAVTVANLRTDARFPTFRPQAVAAGLGAVFTFPLRHPSGPLGALDLYRDAPGELRAADLAAAQTLADVAVAYLLNARARDAARMTTDELRFHASHDALTGLPNRLLLQQRIDHAAQRAQRSHHDAAVLFADLDGFKEVNDTHGHSAGDAVLVMVAQRLSALVRPGDTLARLAGDEFVFLCEDLHSAADAEALARRVEESFAEPFRLGDLAIKLQASVGVAFAGPGEGISTALITQADVAMYRAKRSGGGQHHVIDLRGTTLSSDRDLERDLRAALENDGLDVVYQPIVRLRDGLVTGVEALLRWTDAERGVVPASEMVKVAERSGLITEIGAWVLERSCRERGRWLRDHPDNPLELAVNVSVRQLTNPGFLATVESVLARTGTPAENLVLEITEYVLLEDSERSMRRLTELKGLGLRLALDDFGTGFSSLSYLRRLPIDIVKIDQGFIADLGGPPASRAIVAAVTNLAHVLDLTVTAEGVETAAQHEAVADMSCERGQGNYYARPMSAAEIGAHLGRPRHDGLRLPTARPVLLPTER